MTDTKDPLNNLFLTITALLHAQVLLIKAVENAEGIDKQTLALANQVLNDLNDQMVIQEPE